MQLDPAYDNRFYKQFAPAELRHIRGMITNKYRFGSTELMLIFLRSY
jgi:hypothetical protein